MNTELLVQLLVNGFIVGTLYGVVAMCFVLIYKASRVVNFAQGEFLIIGAFVCFWFIQHFGVGFLGGFLLTLSFMVLFGIGLQYLVLRPMIGEPILSVIMMTIGLSIFFQALIKWLFGVNTQSYPEVFPVRSVPILGLEVETAYLAILGISALSIMVFYLFFTRSRTGLAMRATAFDQQTAMSLGVSIQRMFAIAWAISAVVSAIAGITLGIVNKISFALSFVGIKVFPAVILGGLDSIVGAVVGGIIVGLLENLSEYIDGQYLNWGNMYAIAPFYVLVLILMVRPYGLFGTRDIERV